MNNQKLTKSVRKKKQISAAFNNEKLTSKSKDLYIGMVERYFEFCDSSKLEPGVVSLKSWLDKFESASYYNTNKAALKKFLMKLYENESPERILELKTFFENDLPRKQPKRGIKEGQYLTMTQVESLTKQCQSKQMALIIWALFWTGCRINELLNIKIAGCEINGAVKIRVLGKGNKERDVYMPLDLYKKIKKCFPHSKLYLFETRNNTQFNSVNVSGYIRRAGERLDLNISAHTLRHSKAMFLKDIQQLSPDQIAKALGHSSVITTLEHYFHGTPSAKDQGIL